MEFFPYSNGLAVSIVLAVFIIAVCVCFYVVYKKWKDAETLAIAQGNELTKLKETTQENVDAIKATMSSLEKSDERFKQTLRSNLNVAHNVALKNMATELQKIINENEIGLQAEYLPKEQTMAQNTSFKMIIGMLHQLSGEATSINQ